MPPPPPPPPSDDLPGWGQRPTPAPPPSPGAPVGPPGWNQAPPPPGWVPGMTPPPGYTAYGAQHTGFVKPSAGLSRAMIILYWCVTAASVFFAYTLWHRKQVFDDWAETLDIGNIGVLDDADNLVALGAVLQALVFIAAAILTTIWSKRIGDNARARGAWDVKPGLAAGGWWIPFGNWVIPFSQLRKAVSGVGAGSVGVIGLWQGLFIAQSVIGFASRNTDLDNIQDVADASSRLSNQTVVAVIAAIIYGAAAVAARKASSQVDEAVTGPSA